MKLYTEEQVRQAIELTYLVELYGIRDIKYRHTLDEIIKKLTPISLPSDEEIDEKIESMKGYVLIEKEYFEAGVKWMRDKILNK